MLKVEKVQECVNALKRDFAAAKKNYDEIIAAYEKMCVDSRYLNVRRKGVHRQNTRYAESAFKPSIAYEVFFDKGESIIFNGGSSCSLIVQSEGGLRVQLPYGSSYRTETAELFRIFEFNRVIVEKPDCNPLELASFSSEANQLLLIWKTRVDTFANEVKKMASMLADVKAMMSFLEREADAIEAKRDASILAAFGVAVETQKPRVNRFTITVKENEQ